MKTLKLILVALAAIVGSLLIRAEDANPFTLRTSVIACGASTGTNGPFALSGTIGQPVSGGGSAGDFSLTSGFWGVLQTPEAPLLRLKRIGVNGAVVSWPAPSVGWVLQQSFTLGPPAAWSDVKNPPIVVTESENTVTFVPAEGVRYFRLTRPGAGVVK